MSAKFAVLEYARDYEGIIPDNLFLGKSKTLRNRYIRTKLPYEADEISVLGVEGLNVTLPLTAADAENDERLKDDVFQGVLKTLRQSGIRSVKAGFRYQYDPILPAASGFYVLPFLLPVFLGKCAKMSNKRLSELEALVIDGIYDLTIDILCVISNEINHITVFTDNAERLQNAAARFYSDSGLNINIIEKSSGMNTIDADVILDASKKEDGITNRYKKGAVFLDMAGNKKKTADIALRRQDIIAADGIELKSDGRYLDNVLLETVLLSDSDSFRKYVFGRCGDNDFYDILHYAERQNFALTAFLRGGKRAV